jgi:hypothetical protein
VQRGYYTTPPPEPARNRDEARRGKDAREKDAKEKAAKEKDAPAAGTARNKELIAALHSLYPKAALPTSLALNYFSLPARGMLLTTSIQVDLGASAPAAAADDKAQTEQVEVVGALYDERGELKQSFQRSLSVTPKAAAAAPDASPAAPGSNRFIVSTHLPITPGIYQVRIAAREARGGRTGSASQWVEIPDLGKGKLALSSLFLGEQTGDEVAPAKDATTDALPAVIAVDRRLARTSRLRFFTYVYNAARAPDSGGSPDIALQVQVFRDDQPVITSPLRKLNTEGVTDFTSLPYAAEISLASLASGSYAIQITAIDRVSKTTARQRAKFMVE